MKRIIPSRLRRGWWPAAVLLLACAAPARAQSGFPPPAVVPVVVEPLLFPGLEPVAPDDFGLSPDGGSLVFFDRGVLTLIRTFDAEVIFEERFLDEPTVGFSVDGDTLIIEATARGGATEVRFIDTFDGADLSRFTFLSPVEARVSPFGNGFALLARPDARGSLLLLNDAGKFVFQEQVSALTDLGFGFDAIALAEPVPLGRTLIRLVSIETGRTVLRERVSAPFLAGFNLPGDRFLIASVSAGITRIRLLRTGDGAPVLFRTFRGPLQAGFTPFGEILVVVSQPSRDLVLELFRAADGRRVQRRVFP